jgi:hypothetical protein
LRQGNYALANKGKNMTRHEIEKSYSIDYKRRVPIIISPGKFEGEPIFAPYFWDIALQGFYDADNGTVFTFHIKRNGQDKDNPFIKELKQWLGRKTALRLRKDDQGFVHCF